MKRIAKLLQSTWLRLSMPFAVFGRAEWLRREEFGVYGVGDNDGEGAVSDGYG